MSLRYYLRFLVLRRRGPALAARHTSVLIAFVVLPHLVLFAYTAISERISSFFLLALDASMCMMSSPGVMTPQPFSI